MDVPVHHIGTKANEIHVILLEREALPYQKLLPLEYLEYPEGCTVPLVTPVSYKKPCVLDATNRK